MTIRGKPEVTPLRETLGFTEAVLRETPKVIPKITKGYYLHHLLLKVPPKEYLKVH